MFLRSSSCISSAKRIYYFTSKCWYSPGPEIYNPYKVKKVPKGIYAEEEDTPFLKTEEVKGHWHYVERLFPKLTVPDPPKTSSTTGWRKAQESIPNLPYFVRRTRNHLLPVYEKYITMDQILVTQVRYVQGDIWQFEYDLKTYLEEKLSEKVSSNAIELTCAVNFKGSHTDIVKEWLYSKGF